MEVVRDLEKHKVSLISNEKVLFETGYIGGEFMITISTSEEIIITEELDKSLYYNLIELMDNEYLFSTKISYKKDNELRWLSDQYCCIEDDEELNRIDRIVITRKDNEIKIVVQNPYCEEIGVKKKNYYVAFSPCSNGFYTKNIHTGITFQDDVVIAFNNILYRIVDEPKKYIR